MPVINNNDEGQVLTKLPIETAKPPTSDEVHIVVTKSPVDIEEPHFQPVTATLSSSVSIPRTSSKFVLPFSYGVPVVVTRVPIEI